MQNNFSNLVLLIPSYCPPKDFPYLIEKLKTEGFCQIVVVNDGSPESYNTIFNSLSGVTVLKNSRNEGKGHALKVGFKHILNYFKQHHFVITCDDDGQHATEDVAKLGHKSTGTPENTILLGSRNFNSNVPVKSLIGNYFMRFLIAAFYRKFIKDTQTGLRCIPISMLNKLIDIPNKGFNYEIVTLIHCLKTGTSLIEIPIRTIYFNNNEQTRFKSYSDSKNVIHSVLTSYFRK